MSLTIELAPFETAIIEDELFRNGAEPMTMKISENARILREHEILTEEDANTPAKMLYLAIEHAFLAKANHAAIKYHLRRIAGELAEAAPPLKPGIATVLAHIENDTHREALAAARMVIADEAEILKTLYITRPPCREARH